MSNHYEYFGESEYICVVKKSLHLLILTIITQAVLFVALVGCVLVEQGGACLPVSESECSRRVKREAEPLTIAETGHPYPTNVHNHPDNNDHFMGKRELVPDAVADEQTDLSSSR